MRLRAIAVSVATVGLMVGPAFAHGILSVAGARAECTITGTAADDTMNGNDEIRGGQGDDDELEGDEGSDVVKGQQDDDEVEGADQNDRLYGGQGDDQVGDETDEEVGNDFLKSRDGVSGNDTVNPGPNTDTCRIDAGDTIVDGACEL
jgi:Ca2+-binding RTX toxin-like protein